MLGKSIHLYPGFGLRACSTSTPPAAGAPYTAADGHGTPRARCSVDRRGQGVRPERPLRARAECGKTPPQFFTSKRTEGAFSLGQR